MSDDERGQVAPKAALVYEEFFVPALFAQWTDAVSAAAHVKRGHRVLDVGCGTGVLARAVAAIVGPTGTVVGLDSNEGMLEVARRTAPSIDWRAGRAEELPFPDQDFDAVVSQFSLMFFDNRAVALRELRRVLRSGSWAGLAVWGAIERSPGYAALASLLAELFGDSAAQSLQIPFSLGDPTELASLLVDAGFSAPEVVPHSGVARFPSMDAWMFTEIRGWTLAGVIDDAGFDQLLTDARRRLAAFVRADGTVEFEIEALIARAR